MAVNGTVYGLLFEDEISRAFVSTKEVVKDFFLNGDVEQKTLVMNSYIPTGIVFTYVLLVKWIGPYVMKNRKPFNLKTAMILYNFANASLNLYVAYGLGSFAWKKWPYRCSAKKNPELPANLLIIGIFNWHWILIKFFDLIDTIFFVLRKKNNQITFLHVLHHAGVCLIVVTVTRLREVGFYLLIGVTLNCIVHMVMYTYYCLAAFGPHMQKYLWWKKYITLLQMGQFVVFLFYLLTGFITGCESMEKAELTIFGFVVSILFLFMNFYRKTYKQGKSQKTL